MHRKIQGVSNKSIIHIESICSVLKEIAIYSKIQGVIYKTTLHSTYSNQGGQEKTIRYNHHTGYP